MDGTEVGCDSWACMWHCGELIEDAEGKRKSSSPYDRAGPLNEPTLETKSRLFFPPNLDFIKLLIEASQWSLDF